jgi:hypothetical protein
VRRGLYLESEKNPVPGAGAAASRLDVERKENAGPEAGREFCTWRVRRSLPLESEKKLAPVKWEKAVPGR